MPIPATNVSLANIQSELGGSNPISLSEYYAGGGITPAGTQGTGGAIPTSGQISMGLFRNVAGASFFNTTYTSFDTTKWFAENYHIFSDITVFGAWPNPNNSQQFAVLQSAQTTTDATTIPEWSNRIRGDINCGNSSYSFNLANNGNDHKVDRYLDIQQWVVPVNCSYVVIDSWGAGGGGGAGFRNSYTSTYGGGGMYCRTYLYVGTHIDAGDIITICAGIPGIAGPRFNGGMGGGSSFAWLTNTYTAARLAANVASGTTDAQKRALLSQVSANTTILCAAGGGGGGGNNWSTGQGNHGGGGGADSSNVYGIHEGTTSGTKGGPSAHSNSYILPEPNTPGSTTLFQGVCNVATDAIWNNSSSTHISFTTRTKNNEGFKFYHMIQPMTEVRSQETSGSIRISGSGAGAGVWCGSGGGRMYTADGGANKGCRGGGGGGGGVYMGQSTVVNNGSAYSPGTTSGALGSITTSHAYGGNVSQYNVNDWWLSGSGKPGHIKIKFY